MKTVIRYALLAIAGYAIGAALAQCEAKADGAGLFKANCVACHGDQGLGDGPAAAYLPVKPRNLTKDPFIQGDSVEAIATTISGGLNSQMPAFGGKLTEAEIDSLAKYVRSLR